MNFIDDEDKIGRREFVDKIASCVDHLAEDRNICIAIDGEWGSGKSFVMGMLYEMLNANDSYLVVRYDAWECSFYDEPLFAIFSSILDCAKEKLSLLPGGKKGLKAVGKEIGKDALEELSKKSGKLGNLATFIKGFLKYIGIYKHGATIDTSDERSKEFKSYQSYLKEVQDSLNEYTTHSDYQGKKNKLIILVDELDRCLPDMQLKILERLHHLFDVKNCAVICAINEASVAKNVETTYGVDGYEYLRKFFDLTYKLEKSTEVYLKQLFLGLDNLTAKQCNTKAWGTNPFVGAYWTICSCSEFKKLDNRELSRYYEIIVKAFNAIQWDNLTAFTVYFVIIGLFIKQYISDQFLKEENIKKNQAIVERGYYNSLPSRNEMPYYDYIYHHMGINRKNLPENLIRISNCNLAEYSWHFNEMVCFSVDKHNSKILVYVRPAVGATVCKYLRQVILMYGDCKNGEQKNA